MGPPVTTILVGEAAENGAGVFADRNGRRLDDVFGVDVGETFATVNLVDRWEGRTAHGHAFPKGLAQANAIALWRTVPMDARLLLLGRRVSTAFGLGNLPYLRWFEVGDIPMHRVAVFPHPSRGNRWWSDEANVRRAKRFARRIVKEET